MKYARDRGRYYEREVGRSIERMIERVCRYVWSTFKEDNELEISIVNGGLICFEYFNLCVPLNCIYIYQK